MKHFLIILAATASLASAKSSNTPFLQTEAQRELKATQLVIEQFQTEIQLKKAQRSPSHRAILSLMQNYSENLIKFREKQDKVTLESLEETKNLGEEFVQFLKLSNETEHCINKWINHDLFDAVAAKEKARERLKAKKKAYWEAERKEYEKSRLLARNR